MTPEEFDFLLIRQKEQILCLINKNKLKEASAALIVVKELWCTHSYTYKYEEITERIRKHKMDNQARFSKHSGNKQPKSTGDNTTVSDRASS